MNNITNRQQQQTIPQIENFETGREFEQFVISLFNKDHFWLLDYQESRYRENVKGLDINHPDLYLLFAGKRHYRFAVECKYKKSFYDGRIEWASPKEIKSYLFYQSKFNIPVFIAIGVGGKPSDPEKLFVTPLQNICMYTEVYEKNLYRYKRKPIHKFFYDTIQLRLF